MPPTSSSECKPFCLICVSPVSYHNKLFSGEDLHFLVPPNLSEPVYSLTKSLLAPEKLPPAPTTPSLVKWESAPSVSWSVDGPLLSIHLPPSSGAPSQIAWHRRGDYVASVSEF